MASQAQQIAGVNGNRRWWIAALVVVVVAAVLLLAAWAAQGGEIPVLAESVVRQTILSTIDTNGVVEPADNFRAHAPAPAVVREIAVREGQSVKAGELLVRLDDAEARAQAARALAQVRAAEAEMAALSSGGTREEVLTNQTQLGTAQAELDSARRTLEAMRRLEKQGAASSGEVRDAEARAASAKAQVELLEKKLGSRFAEAELARAQARMQEAEAAYEAALQLVRDSNVRAPRAGTVYSLSLREGQFVNAGELLVQVANLDQVQVRAFVDEPEVGRLREGQEVLVTWDALPERTWKGRITQTPATIVTRGTRNVGEVISQVENTGEVLLPNVNVSVGIVTEREEDALTISREAIREEGGGRYVYGIRDGRLTRQPVQTGLSNLTAIRVTQGLSEGEQVATSSASGTTLEEGMTVRVVKP